MPLVDRKEPYKNTLYQPLAEMKYDDFEPSAAEIAGAVFRLYNSVGSSIASWESDEERTEKFNNRNASNLYDFTQDPRAVDAKIFSAIADSNSYEESTAIISRLNQETKDRKVVDSLSGWGSFAAITGASVPDPFNLLFLSVKGVRSAIAAGATVGGGQELMFQNQQQVRPIEESIAVTVFSGAFWGIGEGVRHLVRGKLDDATLKKFTDRIMDDIDDVKFSMEQKVPYNNVEPLTNTWPKTQSELLSTTSPFTYIPKKETGESIFPELQAIKGTSKVSSSSSFANQETIRLLDMAQKFWNPSAKVAASIFKSASEANAKLVESSGYMKRTIKDGLAAPQAVQSFIKGHFGAQYALLNNVKKDFINYRNRLTAEKGTPNYTKLSPIVDSPLVRSITGKNTAPNISEYYKMIMVNLRKIEREGDVVIKNLEKQGEKEILESISKFRTFFDDYAEEAKFAKILREEGVIKNYVPRAWDIVAVSKNRSQLINRIIQHQEKYGAKQGWNILSKKEVEDAVDAIINGGSNIEGANIAGPRGIFSKRKLDLFDDEFEDFLMNDARDVLSSYVRVASADIEIAKAFGSVDMQKVFDDILDEAKEMISKLDSIKDVNKIAKISQEAEDNIKVLSAMRDVLRGIYGLPENPYALSSRAARIALDFNNMVALGGAVVSSMPDLGRIAMTNGLKESFDQLQFMTKHWKKYRAAAHEVKLAGTSLDMMMHQTALALFGTASLPPRFSRLESYIGVATNGFFIANLLSPWNAWLKQTTGIMVTSNIVKQSANWSKGTISTKNKNKLLQMGLEEKDAKLIEKLFNRYGETVDNVRMLNTQDWKGFAPSITPDLPKGYKIVIGKNTIKNNVYKSASNNRKTKTITLDEEYIKGEQYKAKAWLSPKVKGVKPIDYDFKNADEWFDFVKAHEIMHAKFPNPKKRLKGDPVDADYENLTNKRALDFMKKTEKQRRSTASITDSQITKLRRKFRAALAKNVDQTIVTPGAGDQPLWVHSSWGRFIGQYKSFAFAAANKVLVPAIQQQDRQQLMGLFMMVYLGHQSQAIKDSLEGKDKSYTTEEAVVNGIKRSGILGIYMEIDNILHSLTGSSFEEAITGKQQPEFLGKTANTFLPVGSTLLNAFDAIKGGDMSNAPLPYKDIFWLKLFRVWGLNNMFDRLNNDE